MKIISNYLLLIFQNAFHFIFSFNILLLKINYFYETTKLYYTNAMNNDEGDLYIEYWGEENNLRYFIGINASTGEEINFGNGKIKAIIINSNNNIYHESIIINNNNENNIFSINHKYYEFINLKNGEYSSKKTFDIYKFEISKYPSFRNSIIKLKNGNYLLNIILSYNIYIKDSYYLYLTNFKFKSYMNMDNFTNINTEYQDIDYLNSTSCFQTESGYIQCSYNRIISTTDLICVGVFDLFDLKEKAFEDIADIKDNTFTKIFHIKGEIGAYIYFDKSNNLPNIKIKELIKRDNELELKNVLNFESIVLNGNGKYTFNFNNGLFYSDGIKLMI